MRPDSVDNTSVIQDLGVQQITVSFENIFVAD